MGGRLITKRIVLHPWTLEDAGAGGLFLANA